MYKAYFYNIVSLLSEAQFKFNLLDTEVCLINICFIVFQLNELRIKVDKGLQVKAESKRLTTITDLTIITKKVLL